jgi:hypothetical protein
VYGTNIALLLERCCRSAPSLKASAKWMASVLLDTSINAIERNRAFINGLCRNDENKQQKMLHAAFF